MFEGRIVRVLHTLGKVIDDAPAFAQRLIMKVMHGRPDMTLQLLGLG